MTSRTVLISGAGVAGPTLAYWLARRGFRPTVVELSPGLRSSGNPVDVRGPALPVAEAMGIVDRLREAATTATAMGLVDSSGRRIARVPMPASRSAAGTREVEIARGDLAAILHDTARHEAEYLFDDSITGLRQDGHGVDVEFDRAAPRRFDLVVGADGLHSRVRGLAFGPEQDFVHHLGLQVATMPLDEPVEDPSCVLMHNTPGRLLSIHPCRGRALVAFIFRGRPAEGFDHRDTAEQRRVVTEAYAGTGWRAPELLERLRETDDLYFDTVSRVKLSSWARDRVVLLGDAASCVSLLGDGSSLAMAGAFTLAEALAESSAADPGGHPGGHAVAFRRYEQVHRTRTGSKQRGMRVGAAVLVPGSRTGVAARNAAAKAWSRLR